MRFVKFIAFIISICCEVVPAMAVDYITVLENQIYSEDIFLTDSTFIYNYGIVSGTIHITGSYALQITNYNKITSTFDIGAYNANVVQRITGSENLNVIDNLVGHIVRVEGASSLDMAGVLAAGEHADHIELAASSFLVGAGMPEIGIPIIVDDDVIFFVTGANEDESIPLMTNIVGNPTLQVSGIDPMYSASPVLSGGNLYVHLVRVTDYDDVIGGELGSFLDSVRDVNPNDKLISALDAATTRTQMNRILGESVRTNPIMLARPMRTIAEMLDSRMFGDDDLTLAARSFYVMSRDFSSWGIDAKFYKNISRYLTAYVGIFGATLNYDGALDEFSGLLYGGKVGADYRDSDLYIGARGLFMGASFSDLVVYDGNGAVKNPSAMNADFIVDVGPVYCVFDDIKIVPFIGGHFNYASVQNFGDTVALGRAGVETLFNTVQDGNKYDVGFRASFGTDSTAYVGLRTDMMSNADGIGGGLELSTVHDDSGWSWKIGLNAKFIF